MISLVQLVLVLGRICLCTVDDYKRHGIVVHDKIPIGSGCSASVYKCKYNGSERAVKVFKKRREREVEMVEYIKTLDLPVAPKIHLVVDNIIVMDLVNGESLKSFLAKSKKDKKALGKIVTKLFEAIFAIHRNGIVHVDLHRRNIMIENDCNVKIIDFGDSWRARDFTIDFQRLRYRVLKHIDGWEDLVHFENSLNERPLALIKEFYKSDNFRWVFEVTNYINAPRMEYYCIQFFRTIFFIMNSNLKDLNERYAMALLELPN